MPQILEVHRDNFTISTATARLASDAIADMLTRLRNANTAFHDDVLMPSSKVKEALAKILVSEGYVEGYSVEVAHSFEAANEKLTTGTYDVLILDIMGVRGQELLEAHMFGFEGDLYGRRIEVALHAYLREERKFDDVQALAAQMRDDEAEALRVLGLD